MSQSQAKIKVLIADDTEIAREGLKRLLSGHEDIEVVGDADKLEDVTELIEELRPDVVLVDLKWYGDEKAGIEAIENIRASIPEARILALSAYPELLPRAKTAGATGSLVKGFSKPELVYAIRSIAQERLWPAHAPRAAEHEEPLDDLSLLVAALVHRLSNLIGPIPLLTRQLLDPGYDQTTLSQYLEMIHEAARDALAVLDRLRTLARPLEGGEVVESPELISAALQSCQIPDSITVEVLHSSDIAHLDSGSQAIEVVANLISNAVEAMTTGGRLIIQSRAVDNDWIEIVVSDTGPGIPSNLQEKLFRPFFSTKKPEGGQGLGLWLSRQLVRRLGGSIFLEKSIVGLGTTFVARFPIVEKDRADG